MVDEILADIVGGRCAIPGSVCVDLAANCL
jgi:hypothetical protein